MIRKDVANADAKIDDINADDVVYPVRRCNDIEAVQKTMLSIMMLLVIHDVLK